MEGHVARLERQKKEREAMTYKWASSGASVVLETCEPSTSD